MSIRSSFGKTVARSSLRVTLVVALCIASFFLGYYFKSAERIQQSNVTQNSKYSDEEKVKREIDLVFSLPKITNQTYNVTVTEEALRSRTSSDVPTFAYLITGTHGEVDKILRLLHACYHPRNEYLINLEKKATDEERLSIASIIQRHPTFSLMGNVHVASNSFKITYRGSSMISAYLFGIAALLELRRDWDWFINLSSTDYPVMTQDDILSVFSKLPRDLNFIRHGSNMGWKLQQRIQEMHDDPALFLDGPGEVSRIRGYVRKVPTLFRPFCGSAWVVLSREFCEYAVKGWDNFPRLLLMFHATVLSSPESYFQTLVCNSKFKTKVVNTSLRFNEFAEFSQHPKWLDMSFLKKIVDIGYPFARKFSVKRAKIMDEIDRLYLKRKPGMITPGGWCVGETKDPLLKSCNRIGNTSVLTAGEGATRLKATIEKYLIENSMSENSQCIVDPEKPRQKNEENVE